MSSVLGTVFNMSGFGPIDTLNNPDAWFSNFFSGRQTTAGISVTPKTALHNAAYYNAIRVISEDIGKLPFITYNRQKNGNKERALKHRVYRLLRRQAAPNISARSLQETQTGHALSWGNGYAEIERDGNLDPVALHLIHPSRVKPRLEGEKNGTLIYDVYSDSQFGRQKESVTPIPSENMLHIRGFGDDGIQGYSVVQMGAESFGLGLAAQQFGAAFFGNGAQPNVIITHPSKMSENAKTNFRKGWREMHEGAKKSGGFAILEDGMTVETMAVPPEQAQFLQTRQFEIEEIARWFRIPPSKLQHLLKANFNTLEQQSLEYVVDCLTAWMARWEDEVHMKLFTPREQDTMFAQFIVEGLLRGDSKARAEFYTKQIANGALTPNQVRAKENDNDIGPEGDRYMISANLLPLDMVGQNIAQPEEEKPDEPEDEDGEDDNNVPVPDEEEDEEKANARIENVRLSMTTAAIEPCERFVVKTLNMMSRAYAKHGSDQDALDADLERIDGNVRNMFVGFVVAHSEATLSLLTGSGVDGPEQYAAGAKALDVGIVYIKECLTGFKFASKANKIDEMVETRKMNDPDILAENAVNAVIGYYKEHRHGTLTGTIT